MPKHDELTASTIQSKLVLSDHLFCHELRPLPFAFPAVCNGQTEKQQKCQGDKVKANSFVLFSPPQFIFLDNMGNLTYF